MESGSESSFVDHLERMDRGQLQRVLDELGYAYAEVRPAAEERVVEWHYIAGFDVLDVRPFDFERMGMPRPRLLPRRPTARRSASPARWARPGEGNARGRGSAAAATLPTRQG